MSGRPRPGPPAECPRCACPDVLVTPAGRLPRGRRRLLCECRNQFCRHHFTAVEKPPQRDPMRGRAPAEGAS